jgi:hypothetical protein
MKKSFLLSIMICLVLEVSAKCAFSAMSFYPKQKEISTHSWSIVEGYGTSQSTIESFIERQVYLLSSSGDTIALELQEINVGQKHLTQAVLKPGKTLKPNTRYYLQYSDPSETEEAELMQYNRETKQREKVYWETKDLEKSANLTADSDFRFLDTELEVYGCGKEIYAIFDVRKTGGEEMWYKTELVDLTTAEATTYILSENFPQIKVGHGMCAGGFTYRKGSDYKVRFTAINTDGLEINRSEWVYFESPLGNNV